MSFQPPSRNFLVTASLGAVIALAASGSLANAADMVSFTAGSPWSQQIGSVSKSGNFHEYTVDAPAGKTLQINLISRNPNLYFSVMPADSRTPLIDTQKTGATTWSNKQMANAAYTVRVYEDPDTVASTEVTKFALQIGEF